MAGETLGGAASGAMAGASTGNPYAMAAGAALGAVGGFMGGRAKKKAAKKRLQMMQKALSQFKAGSTDASGNKLSADANGNWKYNLGLSGQAANAASLKANLAAANYNNKSRSEILRNNLAASNSGANAAATASTNAAMRAGLRGNSNLGNIMAAQTRANLRNYSNNIANANQMASNPAAYNAQNRSALAQSAIQSQVPLNNIQTNLQNMVKGLNGSVMSQYNQMAGAAANPYLNGQGTADLFNGLSGSAFSFAQNQQDEDHFSRLLAMLKNSDSDTKGSVLSSLLGG